LSIKSHVGRSGQIGDESPNSARPLLEYTASELVFGLVYAVGTEYRGGVDCLSEQIRRFGYDPVEIRMSDYLAAMTTRNWGTEQERLTVLMDIGDTVRGRSGRGDLVALSAIAKIAAERRRKSRRKSPKPLGKVAYILYSLKHEDEVAALRRVYGSGFYLIGGGYEIKRKKDGRVVKWDPLASTPRVPMMPMAYLQREQLASELFRDTILELESKRRERREKDGHR
jgi:hypothetical protein